jgi:hypothetical protein
MRHYLIISSILLPILFSGLANPSDVSLEQGRATPLEADTHYTIIDAELDVLFGNSLCSLGDVDGDGLPDFAAGDPDPMSFDVHGVDIVSGGTGAIIHELRSSVYARQFGESVASIPDLDGDGCADLVVGAPLYGPHAGSLEPFAELVSTDTGDTLLTVTMDDPDNEGRFTWASAVAGIGDLDGDHVPDVLVGAHSDEALVPYSMAGAVYAHSGADAGMIYKVNGTQSGGSLGVALTVLGDVNHDGVDDFAAGAPGEGNVHIISGSDGAVLGTVEGPASATWFGSAIASVGDVDDDDVPDLIVGDYYLSAKTGAVYMYSLAPVLLGQPQVLLWSRSGTSQYACMGRSVSAAGDVNGDGVPDCIVGSSHQSGPASAGEVDVFSGDTGNTLYHADGPPPGPHGSRFGLSVAGPGDMNGDGALDLVVGEPSQSIVHVLSTGGPWENLCQGCFGTLGVPQLFGHGTLKAEEPFAWHIKDGRPGASSLLVLGFSLLEVPFKGGTVVPALDIVIPLPPLDTEGHLHLSSVLPAGSPAGVEVYFQIWIADTGASYGYSASNGLKGTTQ